MSTSRQSPAYKSFASPVIDKIHGFIHTKDVLTRHFPLYLRSRKTPGLFLLFTYQATRANNKFHFKAFKLVKVARERTRRALVFSLSQRFFSRESNSGKTKRQRRDTSTREGRRYDRKRWKKSILFRLVSRLRARDTIMPKRSSVPTRFFTRTNAFDGTHILYI